MIDTHTHLYSEQFDEDREEMIERAKAAGVSHYFLPAINSSTHEKMIALEKAYPGVMFAMMGLHPCDVKEDSNTKELALVKKYIEERDFCAIGEIGIDLYWDQSTLEIQKEAFALQIDWAIEKDLPIVIHSRDSFAQVMEVLGQKRHPKLRGIFHCFTGTKEEAKKIMDLGFLLGIGGVVTFKNGGIDKFLAEIPLDHIVLETDSPYLAPTPFRGKRNESSYLSRVLDKLVDVYGVERKVIEEKTSQNAMKLFGRP